MKTKELINAYLEEIRKEDCPEPKCLWDAEEILMYLDKSIKKVATRINENEHRWYAMWTNVYKCDDGFVGLHAVGTLKTESMSYSDCGEHVEIFECEEIQTVTYVKKA